VFTLGWVRSIKVKFTIVIVGAIGVAVVMSQVGYVFGWPLWLRPTLAVIVSLVFVQVLAHGMTSPLREMASAAKEISRGAYLQRIDTPSVDEVGQLATAFNAMAQDLVEADRQRRELIANVSHELRTPIAGIRGALENIMDGVVEPTGELVNAMHGRVERLQRLVDDLLDLSRLEAGDVAFELRPLALADVVRGAVEEVRFDHPSVDIAVDVAPDATVQGDPERLHQVVANLLHNAVLHGAAPIAITAQVELHAQAASVRLTVTDSGPGLAPDAQQRVFDRFYRHRSGQGTPPGTGLGLSIARWIVELHGGTITAGSNQPHGARFDVLLPLVAPR
jgi:signal transduction histidine kinase